MGQWTGQWPWQCRISPAAVVAEGGGGGGGGGVGCVPANGTVITHDTKIFRTMDHLIALVPSPFSSPTAMTASGARTKADKKPQKKQTPDRPRKAANMLCSIAITDHK